MDFKRVVVTGLGVISSLGNTVKEYWDNLKAGKSGVGYITYFDTTDLRVKIAAEVKNFNPLDYINRKDKKRLDRVNWYAIAAAMQAVEDSNINFSKIDRERVGVIVSSGIGGLETFEQEHTKYMNKGFKGISPFFIPKLIGNEISAYISILYKLTGPTLDIVTACATSTHSIGEAYRYIKYGELDMVLAGGSEGSITPMGVGGFTAMKALSERNDEPQKASRPFDKDRDGFVIGEGAGVLVLEELNHALKRGAKIYAEVVGYGATSDAYHISAPAEDAAQITRAMALALKDFNLEELDYINAHGTSTLLNDKYETMAIKNLLGDRAYDVKISSIKSMIGHGLGSAGALELISTIKTIQEDIIPPTINYENKDPECDLDYVPNKAINHKVNLAISNSFGFGGHNAVVALKKFKN